MFISAVPDTPNKCSRCPDGNGKAELLWKRLDAHANQSTDRYYNFWNFFSAFVVRDKKYLAEVESILIAAMPTANSSIPRMTRIKMPKGITLQIRVSESTKPILQPGKRLRIC